ncbi:MAG: adenylate/guanylate cyclase domain-containing protein [bacterium]|nr:adenylate/guanylate cyclase domain-containing protein [bacterium]
MGDPASYQAAGLYDPAAPGAGGRLALLEWLAARGITIAQMVRADREASLTGLAGDLALSPGARMTAAELGARVGWPEDRVIGLSQAAGLRVRPHEKAYTESDTLLFTAFDGGEALFGDGPIRRFTHTLGASLATIAEAAVSLFQVNVEGPMRDEGRPELELAQQNLRAVESLGNVEALMQLLFRSHMAAATRRLREARPRASVDTARLAVGFVDLVGFTPLASRMSPRELRDVVERFEDTAHDVVTAGGGRLVKVIGDAVMFITVDPAAAGDVALTLVERFTGDASVTPRGGIAVGEVLVRGGDYYGPIVNLAARVADLAVPSELLVTEDVAAHGGAGLRFAPAGKRMVKGLDAPVSLLTVERAPAA